MSRLFVLLCFGAVLAISSAFASQVLLCEDIPELSAKERSLFLDYVHSMPDELPPSIRRQIRAARQGNEDSFRLVREFFTVRRVEVAKRELLAHERDGIARSIEESLGADVRTTMGRLVEQQYARDQASSSVNIDPSVIWQIGKALWDLVIDNRPVVNITVDWAGAIPANITDWRDLTNWKDAVVDKDSKGQAYFFRFKNGVGWTLTEFDWVWRWAYGGMYQNVGQYITTGMPVVNRAYAMTSETLSCNSKAFNPINYGTKENPLAGLDLEIQCTSSGFFKKTTVNCHVIIHGDGSIKEVTCDNGEHHC